MTAGVVYSVSYVDGIFPYPVPSIVEVDLAEILLADGTHAVLECRVTRYRDVLEFGSLCCRASGTTRLALSSNTVFVDGLSGVDPILS